jgi:APA family basic amino acid/polyamine antiporter
MNSPADNDILSAAGAYEDRGEGLKRTLNAWNLVTLGIGAIMGAGIFSVSGTAAANYAGPAVAISYALSAIACTFAALCYAEMASAVPVAGSAYSYARATMGEFAGWIIGWDLVLEYSLGATTIAVSWSAYVVSFLRNYGVEVPARLAMAPLAFDPVTHRWSGTGASINIPAMLIIGAVTALLVIGVRESANVNSAIVVVKVSIVLIFIAAGIGYISAGNWVTASNPAGSFIPPNLGAFGKFGLSGILRGAGLLFFAYIGFDAISTTAQEARNPQRDMPAGILGSVVICTVLYVLVAIVLTGVVPYDTLNVPDPIGVGIDALGMKWLAPTVKLGAIAGLSSVILVLLLAQPRIFFAMSRDGLLPPVLAKVHSRFHTPYVTTFITGGAAMIVAGFFPIEILGELVSLGALFAFAIVCIGVLILRVKRPELERGFKTPFVYFSAPAGAASSVLIMLGLPRDTWVRLVAWMALGLLIYFTYGRRQRKHARRNRAEAEAR